MRTPLHCRRRGSTLQSRGSGRYSLRSVSIPDWAQDKDGIGMRSDYVANMYELTIFLSTVGVSSSLYSQGETCHPS